jgi:hypothetical protein
MGSPPFSQQSINTPTAVQPDLDTGFLEAVNESDDFFGAHLRSWLATTPDPPFSLFF